jgi:hypothetical protein
MFKRLVLASIVSITSFTAFGVSISPYIGGEFGSTSYTTSSDNSSVTTSAGLGFGGFFGVALTRHFAVELDYTSYGKMNNSDAYLSSLGVLLKGVLPIAGAVDIFGKLGFSNVTENGNSGSNDTGSGLAYAFGLGFKVTHKLEIFGQYQADSANVGSSKLQPSMWSLGLGYRF